MLKDFLPAILRSLRPRRVLPLGQEELFEYDANGNMTLHTDFEGRTTTYEYDVTNRLIKKNLPLAGPEDALTVPLSGMQVPYKTEDEGSCNAQFLPQSDQLYLFCVHTIADADTNGAELNHGAPGTEIIDWTTEISVTGNSPVDALVSLSSDQVDDLLSGNAYVGINISGLPFRGTATGLRGQLVVSPGLVEYNYTDNGQRSAAGRITAGHNDSYVYDARGRLISETKENGDLLEYLYDAVGNRTYLKTTAPGPIGDEVTEVWYVYDELNRLTQVQAPEGNTDYAYDEVGNRTLVVYPNGTEAFYEYDRLNRLTKLTNRITASQIPFSSYEYTLGLAGNRTRLVETTGEPPTQVIRQVDYEYDDIYRLKQEKITEPSGALITTDYFYDKVGNRTRLTRTDTAAPAGQLVVIEYTYDWNDRLTEELQTTEVARGPMIIDGDGYAYAAASAVRPPPQPSERARYWLIGYLGACGIGLLLPLGLLWSRSNAGWRARRRRVCAACVAVFFVPLMAVGPGAVLAAHNEALLYQALSAAGMALGEEKTSSCSTPTPTMPTATR